MVAAAPFGDIVEEGGDKDQLRMRQARPQLNAQGVTAADLFFGEALQLEQYADSVFIDGIGVKQVKLHLTNNMRPLRHIGPQHAMAVHRQQSPANRALMAQHTEEQGPRFGNIAKRLRQMAPGVAQMAKRSGVDTGDAAVAHHHKEHAQNRLRFADKQRVVAQIDKRAAQLKIIINRPRFLIFGERQNRFFKQLDQHLVQLADPTSDAEEILHHMFDRLVAFAFIAQATGDAELPVEQQAIIVAVELKMKRKTNPPQLMQAFIKLVALGFGQEAETDHFIKRGGAEMAARDPLQSMNIAQAAGAAFHIRLQVIAGSVIALMADILFFNFCRKEFFRWPEAIAEDVFLQFKEQRDVAYKQTRFDQVGGDAEV